MVSYRIFGMFSRITPGILLAVGVIDEYEDDEEEDDEEEDDDDEDDEDVAATVTAGQNWLRMRVRSLRTFNGTVHCLILPGLKKEDGIMRKKFLHSASLGLRPSPYMSILGGLLCFFP